MSSMCEHDVSMLIDMDEMGVRPVNWFDDTQTANFDDTINGLFRNEKNGEFNVYTAEIQSTHANNKVTTNDDSISMSDDDDDETDYDIDPETGEKIFWKATFTLSSSPLSPVNKWVEEYLSNLESSSNQLLPQITTVVSNDLILDNISSALFDPDETDLFSDLIHLDDNSGSIMFTESIFSSPPANQHDQKSTLSICTPTTTNDSHLLSLFTNSSNVLNEDEYSTSSSSSFTIRQPRLHSSVESDNETLLAETKLEKVETEDDPMSHLIIRRASTRSSYQGPQDEETLLHHEIPLTVDDITQSSTEDYNQHLARLSHLNTEKIHIIKDIRRRGKNKIAAQNCRKRKAVGVDSLLDEVDHLKRVKHELEMRKKAFQEQIAETRRQYEYLHLQVLPDHQLPPAIIVN